MVQQHGTKLIFHNKLLLIHKNCVIYYSKKLKLKDTKTNSKKMMYDSY